MGNLSLKAGWKMVKFGDVVRNVNLVERKPESAGIDRIVGLEHLDSDSLHIRRWDTLDNGTSFTRKFLPGQTLFGKRRAYQRKVAFAEFEGICSGDILTLQPIDSNLLLPELLPFICQTDAFFDYALGTSAGSLSPRTSWTALKDFEFMLPTLDEQRQIREVLCAIDEAAEHWFVVLSSLGNVKHSMLESIFSIEALSNRKWKLEKLKDVASLQTGIAKGHKYADGEHLIELPYLRVANVKDGYLDLGEIKTISVSASEIDRFTIQEGDVLLTEGGDFDKLGRGSVWKNEIEHCLHQNHIFCVRPSRGVLLPEFLSYQTGSPYGKAYFLKCAKKTSNLASINSTQVKDFPVLVAPMNEQYQIIEELQIIDNSLLQNNLYLSSLKSLIKGLSDAFAVGGTGHV
ncbi:MAG TPA: restriction endonuclease subunit S [Armatimonadota bacterium]|nr:restriction endonuclease subunit S [Armatimonadota bacterium]